MLRFIEVLHGRELVDSFGCLIPASSLHPTREEDVVKKNQVILRLPDGRVIRIELAAPLKPLPL